MSVQPPGEILSVQTVGRRGQSVAGGGAVQDWAAAHGFEVHLAAGLVDANVTAVRTAQSGMSRG